MQNLLIPIGIMIGLSVLTWLVQQMKNTSDRRQIQRERQRQRDAAQRAQDDIPVVQPVQRNDTGTVRTQANAVDRFLAEIDRLRQTGPAPTAPVATARPAARPVSPPPPPARKATLADQPSTSFPPAPTTSKQRGAATAAPTAQRVEDLPVAAVVGPATPATPRAVRTAAPAAPATPAQPDTTSGRTAAVVSKPNEQSSPMAKRLAALLKDPKSIPMAVVLQEILSEPKSRRRG